MSEPPTAHPARRALLLFALLLVLFPAIATVGTFIDRGWAGLSTWDRLLLIACPLLLWLWGRHFSVLGCRSCRQEGCKSAE